MVLARIAQGNASQQQARALTILSTPETREVLADQRGCVSPDTVL